MIERLIFFHLQTPKTPLELEPARRVVVLGGDGLAGLVGLAVLLGGV